MIRRLVPDTRAMPLPLRVFTLLTLGTGLFLTVLMVAAVVAATARSQQIAGSAIAIGPALYAVARLMAWADRRAWWLLVALTSLQAVLVLVGIGNVTGLFGPVVILALASTRTYYGIRPANPPMTVESAASAT